VLPFNLEQEVSKIKSLWCIGAFWFCSAGLQPGMCRPKGRRYVKMSHYTLRPALDKLMRSLLARRRVPVGVFLGLSIVAGLLLTSRPPFAAQDTSPSQAGLARAPKLILWVWEHPSDLHYIDPSQVGVAFLASTIHLSGERVEIRPRLQPLKVPPETFMMATLRIETNQTRPRLRPPSFSSDQRSQTVAEVIRMAHLPFVQAVQIDFDATYSERVFYGDLLADVRRQLPASTALSITALASWCSGDNWLSDLPIDEAVPMLFRMGLDRRGILRSLRSEGKFAAEVCNQSIGVSMDEPLDALPARLRVYMFQPGPWSEKSVEEALGGLPR